MKLGTYLKEKRLIIDGAFGTYYNSCYETNELPELANLSNPDRVINIHREYIKAGAKLIRTNTFACNTISLDTDMKYVRENISAAINNARKAVGEDDIFIAASIGPLPLQNYLDREAISDEYLEIAKIFVECGITIFDFETFDSLEYIKDAIKYCAKNGEVLVSFAVNQYGYSSAGLSARKLCNDALEMPEILSYGLNCGVGPTHMITIMDKLQENINKPFMAIPNVGYPSNVSGRMIFLNRDVDYFADKIQIIADKGARILGGCCGTTPEYISKISGSINIDFVQKDFLTKNTENTKIKKTTKSFFYKKHSKLIAVELAPPFDGDDEKLISSAMYLKNRGVDVLTFPDSPSGRTRADSILVAGKVQTETGMCVMPHICCRDKNAIAIRSQLLGAYINDIRNFLVITGDPIPSLVRSTVKSVFNFDSVGLMNVVRDMNEDQFSISPMTYGGAINQGRSNFKVEMSRVLKKVEAGATFFFSQPIFSDEDVDRLRIIKEKVGKDVKILAGIMPFVSIKNASFMKNEMAGINVTDRIISMYNIDMTKEEGEMVGINLAKEMMQKTDDFIDGYYFSFPFNRVYMLDKIIKKED